MESCNGCKSLAKLTPTDIGFLCEFCISYYAKYNLDLFSIKYYERRKKKGYKETMRMKLWKKDRICKLCNQEINRLKDSSVDHIIPISKGGPVSDFRNLQLAHKSCNQLKGDKVFVKNLYLYLIFSNKKLIIRSLASSISQRVRLLLTMFKNKTE